MNLYSPSSDTRDHGNTRTLYVGYRSLCNNYRRLVTSFLLQEKSIFPLTRKSIFPLTRKVHVYITRNVHLSCNRKVHQITREILHKNVLCLRDHRDVVIKPRWWLAFAHRATQIWQHVWRDRRGVRLGDAINQGKRRIITFWR